MWRQQPSVLGLSSTQVGAQSADSDYFAYVLACQKAMQNAAQQWTAPDLSAVAPVLTAKISGNHVAIGWGWGGNDTYLDACEIQVDRSDTHGFVLLAQDTTPGYNNTAPLPAAPTKWTYKAIYRVGDARVGGVE